ncbi:MAG: hypothetical protein ACK4WD_00445 [Flavobacteriales bacterium]|jgi:hypothetical protein
MMNTLKDLKMRGMRGFLIFFSVLFLVYSVSTFFGYRILNITTSDYERDSSSGSTGNRLYHK